MRFANVPAPTPDPRAPASNFIRRLFGAFTPPASPAKPISSMPTAEEVPCDLDQRVRLVGEW